MMLVPPYCVVILGERMTSLTIHLLLTQLSPVKTEIGESGGGTMAHRLVATDYMACKA